MWPFRKSAPTNAASHPEQLLVVVPGPLPGTVWDGLAAICDDAAVDHRHGAYALTDDGKGLLLVNGTPVRLVTVIGADGEHHYEVADRSDPPVRHHPDFAHVQGATVALEPETMAGHSGVGA